MRILMVTPWFPTTARPGAGIFVRRDAEMLAEKNDVVVLHLAPPGEESVLHQPEDKFRVLSIPFKPNDPKTSFNAAKLIRKLSVHADLINSVAMQALIPVKFAGVRISWVHTEHHSAMVSAPVSLRMRVGRAATAWFYRYPNEVVAVGEELAAAIDKYRRKPSRIIDNYVRQPDRDLVDLYRNRQRGANELRLVSVGNLIDTKGVLQTVEAVAELFHRGHNVQLVWAGTGILEPEARELAENLGVADRVSLPGFQDPDALTEILLSADVFVLPTKSETFGVAFAEATNHGLPVVAAGRGPHTRFLMPQASKILRQRTPLAIADAIEALINNPNLPSADEIRAYAASRFDESKRGASYQSLFEGLVSAEPSKHGIPDNPSMIFHTHYALNRKATSASSIRPVQMRDAFESLGYTVFEVTGHHSERRLAMQKLRGMLKGGWHPDFVYSESATWPVGLGEKVTFDTSLTRDMNFLRYCRKVGIPVGLFYRDIYWKYWGPRDVLSSPLRLFNWWRYHADLRAYRTATDVLFVPSKQMAKLLPKALRTKAYPLPPGAQVVDSPLPLDTVSLVYVGGLGNHYRLDLAARVATSIEGIKLTICCREPEWAAVKDDYPPENTPNFEVKHASGASLGELYDQTNIGLFFVEPSEYRTFAVGVKMFEYLAHGKPIIASEGTLVGEYVRKHDVGWVIPYSGEVLESLLRELMTNTGLIAEKAAHARKTAQSNTWPMRAREAVEVLEKFSQRL